MIKFTHIGNFDNTERFFRNSKRILDTYTIILNKYGQEGVAALSAATPIDTGLTASSWDYSIYVDVSKKSFCRITWTNSNFQKGVPIAIILQYGHGTGTGGWVQGRDYINPAIQPIFDKIAEELWREVSKL